MNNKQLVQVRDQLKKQILDLDHQILQLETFYIEDTRDYGNLLRGFENYITSKTARNQPINKKQKVQNFERLFSLSSIKSKTSQIYEQSYLNEPSKMMLDSSQMAPKRNRGTNRGGMNKGTGKHLMGRQDGAQEEEENSVSNDNVYSMEESNHVKGGPKRKKISKGAGKSIKKV